MKFIIALLAIAPAFAQAYDCRANIKAAVCIAEDMSDENLTPEKVRCLPGSDEIVKEFEAVHDELPEKLRAMFCHIDRIFISNDVPSTALSVFRAEGHYLAFNTSKTFGTAGMNEWLQRKDQNVFGYGYDSDLTPKVPKLDISLNTKAREQLVMIVIHEFGHLLDEANGLQNFWAKQSWLPSGAIRAEDRYSPRPPCFYNCLPEETWNPSLADTYYRKFLKASSFVSLYASVDSSEDFAETFAYFYAEKLFGMKASLKFEDGKTERLDGRRRKKLGAKFDFVKAFSILPWEYGAHNLCADSSGKAPKTGSEVEGCPGRR